jgi:hypothetical protein
MMGDIKFVALPMDFISSRFNQRIINSYGYAAIGRFMALMESLSKTDNEVNLSDREEWLNLMDLLRFKEDNEMQEFLDIIKASPDFNFVGNVLSSRLVSETQERLEEKSTKARTNAQKRWKKCDGNATAMQPQCDGTNEKCDRIEAVCDGNADVCYNNTLQDITLQDKTIKNNTPHNSKTDDKTEVKHYTDKIIYNEDVRKFRNKRFVELADKLPPDEVSQLVNLESERLFVLREEAA